MRARALLVVITVLAAAFTRPALAQTADQEAVAAVARAFHEALARGDSLAALRLLAPDALILESGGLETRAEYRGHHLPADIAFARAVTSDRMPPTVVVAGDVAWVVGTSRATGTYRERAVNSAGAELMVLTRTGEGWQIRAIHWSSRTIRTP
jgi:ketosteroid isomerase-like protein